MDRTALTIFTDLELTTSSAPFWRTVGKSSSERTTPTTRAPWALAIWTAAEPVPPVAPMITTVSPDDTPATATIASHAVTNERPAVPAASIESAAGFGVTAVRGKRRYSACEP